jgi:hypothetical protein
MAEQAGKRIAGSHELDDSELCYFEEAGIWWLYLPGCGLANLKNHTVVENPDQTITVTPSILLTGHEAGEKTVKHGYLTAGIWREC